MHNFLKTLSIIYHIERDDISYPELIEFLYGETPPENHNFLNYDYAPYINNVMRFGSDKNNPPLFSIIIPTYNRHYLLSKTLNAIVKQENIPSNEFELVIADNGSKDEIEKTVKDFTDQNGRIKIVYVRLKRNYGADFARNAAVLKSRGKLLAFTDDDCIVPPDWLIEFKRELDADPAIAGIGGFKVPRSTREHLDIYHRFLMWKHFYSPHVRTKEFNFSQNHCGLTANVCYRRKIFEKLGGFNLYFKHIGFQEFKTRVHKSGLKLLYEPKMAEHFAYFNLRTHVAKLFPQSLDRYLLYKLYPSVWPNPSFLYFLKRTIGDIKLIFNEPTAQERSRYLVRSRKKIKILDIILFSFVSIVTNFFLWFGKYWIIVFG